MAGSEDTEITLGTGKMLALFFGLVALCAVFFGSDLRWEKTPLRPTRCPGGSHCAGATRGPRRSSLPIHSTAT